MAEPTFEWVEPGRIRPNPWNPNAMDAAMYAKAIESIHHFGFVDPITVRTTVEAVDVHHSAGPDEWLSSIAYEIIDGEHRWKAGSEHGRCVRAKRGGGWERHGGLEKLPITNLGVVEDTVAQQLTIVLNETRGEYDPKKMGALLTDLLTVEPLPQLLEVLPFSDTEFRDLAELPKVDWDAAPTGNTATGGSREEKWVERIYRMPVEAAAKLDRAITEWRDREGEGRVADWRALEAIAEEFLGS